MKTSSLLFFLGSAGSAISQELLLVDFTNGTSGTKWVTENDPVMGGVSNSNSSVGSSELAWDGEVKIVPSLDAPGFCLIYTEGVNRFSDASAYSALTLKVRSTIPYDGFKAAFSTSLHRSTQFAMFKADFPGSFAVGDSEWVDVAIPFNNFTWSWSSYTGEPINTCASDPKYCPTAEDLATITALEVWAEGSAGAFHLDLQSIGAV